MNIKKPKFWDLEKPNFFSFLLFPLTIFFKISNIFLDRSNPVRNNNIKTICIGNIYIGGTGKTPTTVKLYNITKKLGFNVVAAKKFYESEKDEHTILKKNTNFITEKTRKKIIESAIEFKKDLIIFDDGLQDKKTYYDLRFVCFNIDEWIGNGQLIPSGPLREDLKSLKKYDAVFIKGNNLSKSEKILEKIKIENSNIKIFFTKYKILNLNDFDLKKKYLLFCGIGNPNNFKNFLIKEGFIIDYEIFFPDHYNYKHKDFENILSKSNDLDLKIITTEKDFVKIPTSFTNNIKYIKVDLEISEEDNLINFLKNKL